MSFRKPFHAVPIAFGARARAKARKRRLLLVAMAAGVFSLTFAGGLALTNSPVAGEIREAAAGFSFQSRFPICRGPVRETCVVDGDTFWMDGEKIRIVSIDTPELEGRCDYEIDLAMRARDRLQELLNDGEVALVREGADRYGRTLATVIVGEPVDGVLIREGLARPWTGRRQPWC